MKQNLSVFYVYKKTNKNINIIYIYFLEKGYLYLKENMLKMKRQIKIIKRVYTHVYVYTSTYLFYFTLLPVFITHSSRSKCSFLSRVKPQRDRIRDSCEFKDDVIPCQRHDEYFNVYSSS